MPCWSWAACLFLSFVIVSKGVISTIFVIHQWQMANDIRKICMDSIDNDAWYLSRSSILMSDIWTGSDLDESQRCADRSNGGNNQFSSDAVGILHAGDVPSIKKCDELQTGHGFISSHVCDKLFRQRWYRYVDILRFRRIQTFFTCVINSFVNVGTGMLTFYDSDH